MNKILQLGPSYKDQRGDIQMIIESCLVGSISRITSISGSTRANHWHKLDGHYMEVLEGTLELYERPLNSKEKPTKLVLKKGDIAFTGHEIEHTMYFPEYCVANCYSVLERNQKTYEGETTRFDYSLRDVYNNWKN